MRRTPPGPPAAPTRARGPPTPQAKAAAGGSLDAQRSRPSGSSSSSGVQNQTRSPTFDPRDAHMSRSMLWLLLALLPSGDGGRIQVQDVPHKDGLGLEAAAVTTRPHIHHCRSPNMEDFSCWWLPLDNLTAGEPVTYVLTYSKGNGPRHECPDYGSAGPFSCHFDSLHTAIWTIYCLNVTAVTANANYTSQEHCLDVVNIVETEAPVNLTYQLTDAGGHEMGHSALLSWSYPVPSDLQYGWITLVYELQYRRVSEPGQWKVKHPLWERRVELLGLPVGDYVVRVRCRSQNDGLWSRWSAPLLMSLPSGPPAGKVLVPVLVTGVAVVALLVVLLGVVPHGRRIKDYFLPPIPKPRIIGIDPLLLKKGNVAEVNSHFSNFHGYSPPSYREEVWDRVSAGDAFLAAPKYCCVVSDPTAREKDALMVPCDPPPAAALHRLVAAPPAASYVQSVSPYCSSPPLAFGPPPDAPSPWSLPEVVSLPGTEYSVAAQPGLAAATAGRSPQDFYTCVQLMHESGEVHLVPCLPPAYCREFPPPTRADLDAVEKEEKKKVTEERKDGGKAKSCEAAVPLLPLAVDSMG
ncbi:growth hormone receptor-like [Clinocottus analis]|uniref:growth hormone receptor-like n=1 Tax=Clinocottus analis TaxID=304258 RepID=UPI0035C07ADC